MKTETIVIHYSIQNGGDGSAATEKGRAKLEKALTVLQHKALSYHV